MTLSDFMTNPDATPLPDFMTSPNAVLGDTEHEWRYGRVPNYYSKINAAFDREKTRDHEEGSLPWLISNLIKNWYVEMSYKLRADQHRTINQEKFRFSVNGLGWNTVDKMLKTGASNALIGESELYKASENPFPDSQKLFRRAMPIFMWEVLEVYSGFPVVTFKWRHWGKMTGDLSVKLGNGKKLEAYATNEYVESIGVTIVKVNDKFEMEELETFYDANILMEQLAKNRKNENGETIAANASENAASKCPFLASATTN
ncbi:hypothetical protein BGZ83_009957 [Gryganskiella cystojenkinii]|nr:hypothetical protein BGZ83_009957 [Gryganskiella cystojenkinii]